MKTSKSSHIKAVIATKTIQSTKFATSKSSHHNLIAAMLLAVPSFGIAQPAADTPKTENKPTASAAEAEKTLKVINVIDSANKEAAGSTGYNAAVSKVGKTNQALRDIPQSVTVVPEQLIKDRGAETFKEAVRNVAGLTFNAGEGGRVGDNITLRGFSVVGDLYLDNLRDVAQYNRDTFNVESIDILRGSASMLYGRGSAGGLINQASKTPRQYGVNEIGMTFGNFKNKRVTADLHHSFAPTTNGRLNLMFTDTGSFRDVAKQKRIGIAPSIVFGGGEKNQTTLSHFYLKEDNIPDYGVPYQNNRPLDVPVNTFYGLANADYERNNANIFTASHQILMGSNGTLVAKLRAAKYQRDLWVTAPRYAGALTIDAPNNINRGRPARGGEETPLIVSADWSVTANLQGIKFDNLIGVEVATEKSKRWTNGNGVLVNPAVATQIANPATQALAPNASPDFAAGYFTRFRYNPNSFKSDTQGVYAQSTVSVTKDWKVVAGLRWDQLKGDYDRTITAAGATQGQLESLTRVDRVVSKKIGVLYQPTNMASYYASYGTSFNPSAELYQLDPRGVNTPPELNRNIEAGAKFDLLEGDLAIRSAIYRTQKTNERNTDVTNPNVYLLSGKRHTDGIEFEIAGRLTPQWEVFASAALQRARIDNALNTTDIGKVPTNTPRYTSSLWTTYQLSPKLKLGGGIEHVALRYASNANTNALPSYKRVDALLEYRLSDTNAVALNIQNLANVNYYEGAYTGHVVPGTKRAAKLTWTFKF